jgi:hypothetical protein
MSEGGKKWETQYEAEFRRTRNGQKVTSLVG